MNLNHFFPVLGLVLAAGALPVRAEEPLKVATINMSQVFSDFNKTKEAEAKINGARAQAKAELDDRVAMFKQAETDAQALKAAASEPTLTERERDDRLRSFNAKLQELQSFQAEVQGFQKTRERQISEQSTRSRNSLVDEINQVISMKTEKYDLVFDKSGQSLNSVNVLLFSGGAADLTNEILAALNAGKPQTP